MRRLRLRAPGRRLRTPTILQMEAVECGAACLGIVLGYHGRHVPLGELRQACGVSRDGAKASNLLKVAGEHGLAGRGFRRLAHRVLEGPFPAIILWEIGHFVVVEGVRGDRVFINDPQTGPRRVTRDEFETSYSGIVLTFERTDRFVRGGSKPGLARRMLAMAAGYRAPLTFVAMLGVLLAPVTFILPGLLAAFVNDVLVDGLANWLRPLVITAAGVAVLQAALTWLKQGTLLRLEIGMGLQRSADLIWHILRLPAEFFEHRYLGSVVFRATSVDRVAQLLTSDLGGAALNALTAAILLLLMAFIAPGLAAIACAGLALNVVAFRRMRRARTDAAIRLRHEQTRVFSTSMIGIATIETLKATGAEDDFFAKWASQHAQSVNAEQRLARFEQVSTIVPAFAAILTTAAILTAGGLRVIHGSLTLGALLGVQSLFMLISAPVQRVVETMGRMPEAMADVTRLDDVFDTPVDWRHEAVPAAAGAPAIAAAGLRLDNVSFGYSRLEPPLVDGLSLDVPPGRWLALVGPSGSGKSTIGKLVAGLYLPWTGSVLLDGRPLTAFDRRTLANLLAWVPQEVSLFAGTVNDNLTLWDTTLSRETIAPAIRDAAALDIIEAMPGTFAAPVEEGGRNLSGGERQRIEIARALARTPSLLVLDEATSAIDPATEAAVMAALRRRGITCVVIAHRLSTIRDCDEIVVLEHGRVVERGDHAQLLAQGGAYARLIAEGDAT